MSTNTKTNINTQTTTPPLDMLPEKSTKHASDGAVSEPRDLHIKKVYHGHRRGEAALGPHSGQRTVSAQNGFTRDMLVYYSKNSRDFVNTLDANDKLKHPALINALQSVWICECVFAASALPNWGTVFIVAKEERGEHISFVFATARHVVCGDQLNDKSWPAACTTIRIGPSQSDVDTSPTIIDVTGQNLVFPDPEADFALLRVDIRADDVKADVGALQLQWEQAKKDTAVAVIGYPGAPEYKSDDFKKFYQIAGTDTYALTNLRSANATGQSLDDFLESLKVLFACYNFAVLSRGTVTGDYVHDANTTGGMSGGPVLTVEEHPVVIGVHWGSQAMLDGLSRNYFFPLSRISTCSARIKLLLSIRFN